MYGYCRLICSAGIGRSSPNIKPSASLANDANLSIASYMAMMSPLNLVIVTDIEIDIELIIECNCSNIVDGYTEPL